MGKIIDRDVAKEYIATISAIRLPDRKAAKISIAMKQGNHELISAMTFTGLPYALHPTEEGYGLTLMQLGVSIVKDVSSETCVSIIKGLIHAGMPFTNIKRVEETKEHAFADERKRMIAIVFLFTGKSNYAPAYYYDIYKNNNA